MKFLGKAKNKWGWLRVAGWAALAGVLAWMVLAFALRNTGTVQWLIWSGYETFSLLDGLEIAVIPVLLILAAGWMEEQDHSSYTEQSRQREAEQAAAVHQKTLLHQFEATVQSVLHEETLDRLQASNAIRAAIQAILPELNRKGKGELLHYLCEKRLLSDENPFVKLNDLDFSNAELHNARLNEFDLEHIILIGARMDGAHLARARLSGAVLEKAFLRHADLRNAYLAGCNLAYAHLENANLEGAILTGAGFQGTFLSGANLKGCILSLEATHEVKADAAALKKSPQGHLILLQDAILIETTLPGGQKITNEKGKEHIRHKEMASLIDKL